MSNNNESSRQPHPSPTGVSGGGSKVRNLIIRTLTGIVFVAVMVFGIVYSSYTLAALFALITALTAWEFTGIVNTQEDCEVNRFITTAAATFLFLGFVGYTMTNHSPSLSFTPWLLTVIYLLIAELYLQHKRPLFNWAASMMAQLYIALPFGLLCMIHTAAEMKLYQHLHNFGYQCVLAIFVLLWCSDTGAYCTGSLIGRHKLFPRISPAKTWEGSIGGGVLALVASQVFAYFCPILSPIEWAGFALVIVVFGTWGDLIESLLKRQLGIKDSGHILPGHGGMLDRFDSSLLAIPAAYVYLLFISMV